MTSTDSTVLRTPLCDRLGIELPIISAGMGPIAGPDLVAAVSGGMATDRGGKQGVSMNGAGNIAGLLTEVLPAATVVERMAAEAAARLAAR